MTRRMTAPRFRWLGASSRHPRPIQRLQGEAGRHAACRLRTICRREAEFNGTTDILLDAAHAKQLVNMRQLSLYGNKLQRLTHVSTLAHCHHLEELNVRVWSPQSLRAFPRSSRLPKSRHCACVFRTLTVQLGNNFLTDLPSSFGALTPLKRLWLEDNRLASFPSCLLRLPHLEVLRMSGNKLAELPDGISRLTELQELVSGGMCRTRWSRASAPTLSSVMICWCRRAAG